MDTSNEREVKLRLNGVDRTARVRADTTMLELVRDVFGLTGTKLACGEQVCGACTILVNGAAVSSCTYLAYEADGSDVLTIEGVGTPEKLHPVQQAFIDAHGFQCGFCTSGMIVSTVALLSENPHPTREDIIDYLNGNICRCTGYVGIIEAVQLAASRMNQPPSPHGPGSDASTSDTPGLHESQVMNHAK